MVKDGIVIYFQETRRGVLLVAKDRSGRTTLGGVEKPLGGWDNAKEPFEVHAAAEPGFSWSRWKRVGETSDMEAAKRELVEALLRP